MNEPYDPDVHGPDVELAAAQAPGEADGLDLTEESGDEAPPRRRSRIATGIGALVRPSREARFGLAALLSFLILVTVLIMKREKPGAAAIEGRRIPVARIPVKGPAPGELALAPAASAPAPDAVETTPPIPPPASASSAAEPPIAPAPLEADVIPAPVDPLLLAANEKAKEETPELPPDLPGTLSEAPGAEAKDEPASQPPLPADPVPAPSPDVSPAPAPDTAPAASTPADIPEPSPPAAGGPSSPEDATTSDLAAPAASGPSNTEVPPPQTDLEAPASGATLPAPSPDSAPDAAPAPALSPVVDLPAPAESPAPMPAPAAPPESPAMTLPESPDGPAEDDASPDPGLPATKDAETPPESSEAQEPPAPAEAPGPGLPAPVDVEGLPASPGVMSPEPVEAPAVAPSEAPEEGPAQATEIPSFTSPPETEPPASKPAEDESQGPLVTIPNVDPSRLFSGDLEPSDPPADTTIERPEAPDREAEDRVEAVPHVVQKGENFWTIARLSYGSGRFYKALWAANKDTVPVIDELYVGTTILIPPPEALDPSLIIPARPTRPARTASAVPSSPVRRTSRSTLDVMPAEPREIEVNLPAAPPVAEVDPEPGVGVRPRLPVYRIRANETLRSIANRTLGDSHREDEIFELNRTVIKDPHDLTPGQEIKLPADARVGRRAR